MGGVSSYFAATYVRAFAITRREDGRIRNERLGKGLGSGRGFDVLGFRTSGAPRDFELDVLPLFERSETPSDDG
jgi:hypothetical protein